MEMLERHFDTAVEAPDGIKKLRELILTLAMKGKLIPQNPNDPPASGLLKHTEAEKKRLVKEGIFRDNNETLSDEFIAPFELPYTWRWASVQQIGFVLGGKRLPHGHVYSESPTAHRYLTVTNMKNATIIDNDIKYITRSTYEEIKKYIISKDDIYITIAGTIGAVGTVPEQCDGMNLTENASRLVFFGCDKLFLVHLLNSPLVQGQFAFLTNRMAQPKLSLRSILSVRIPIPPLPEQRRIVAKIDELMTQCDALEKLRMERDAKRLAMHTAAVRQLLNIADTGGHIQAREFLRLHFGELHTVKENITGLRKAILQLAIMGKLVPQDHNDTPASALLKQIEAEKKRLVKEGKIRAPKSLPSLSSKDVPFSLPHGWEWAPFANFATEIATGPFGSMIHQSDYVSGGVPLINPSHMIAGKIVSDPEISIPESMAKDFGTYRLKENDIVMARRGEMGRCALVTHKEQGFLCGTGSFILRFDTNVDRDYILNFFRTEYCRDHLGGNSVGTTMTNLNQGIMEAMPVPVPPVQQQRRIVARIDQLMNLCDTLEQQIDASRETQSALLTAMMAQYGGQQCA